MIGRVLLAVLASVATYCEGDRVRNVDPPTRLDIVMTDDGGQAARCADMGGELILYPRRIVARYVCENVDY